MNISFCKLFLIRIFFICFSSNMKNIPDNLLLLKNEKNINFVQNQENINWLLLAFDRSFILISSTRELVQINQKGEKIFKKHLSFPTIRAGMLSLDVVVVLSSRSLQLFDLKNHEEIDLISQQVSPVLWPSLTELFIFEKMLFCVINFSQKEGESQLLYYDGDKVMKEWMITPVHTWKSKKIIENRTVSKGNTRSKVCWFSEADKKDYNTCIESYEIIGGNTGVHEHYPLIGKDCPKNIIYAFTFQIRQYLPNHLIISFGSIYQKNNQMYAQSQFCCYKTSSNSFFVGDEYSIPPQNEPSTCVSVGINLFKATAVVSQQYSLHYDKILSRKLYLLESQSSKLEKRYQWDLDCSKNICFDQNSEMIYEWKQAEGQVTIASWTFTTFIEIYVFFMSEMELDDDLIWDSIRLLIENE